MTNGLREIAFEESGEVKRVFEGILMATWFGDDVELLVGGVDVGDHLTDLAGQCVRVTVEVV